MQKPPWMRMAELFLGESEIPGAMHNDKIIEMFRLIGHPEMSRDEIPWCAAAVGACLSLSGYRNTKSALARSYETFGQDLGGEAVMGCLAVFSRGDEESGQGHVGFYAGEKDGKILLLGGNQNDTFDISSYDKERLLCYRWPVLTAELPETFLPTILDIAAENAPLHLRAAGGAFPPIRTSLASSEQFLRCHEIIARWEGGYSDHPNDPGGATNFGITIGTLSAWRGRAVTKSDVRDLSYGEALEIFAARYWRVIQGDELAPAVALMTYNAAMNSGPSRGVRFLQEALNRQGAAVDIDGEMGPQTLRASARADARMLVKDYAETYTAFYESLPTFGTFGRGWLNRLSDVEENALIWLGQTAVASEELQPRTDEKNAPSSEELTEIDKVLGGRWLAGKKTLIATTLYVLIVIAQALGLLEGTILQNLSLEVGTTVTKSPQPAPSLVMPIDAIKTILLSLAGLGALSKVERGMKQLLRPGSVMQLLRG